MSDKLPKVKHNHTLTDILKASIFSLVMMAPVTAIGVTCAYVVCNKNAYQSYSGTNTDNSYQRNNLINETNTNNVVRVSELVEGNYYTFNGVLVDDIIFHQDTEIDLELVKGDLHYELDDTNDVIIDDIATPLYNSPWYIRISYYGISMSHAGDITVYVENIQELIPYDNQLVIVKCNYFYDDDSISFLSKVDLSNYDDDIGLYTYQLKASGTLDNVFYYAVDTMQNNTLFSWTKTTAIYTPVNAMTTGMGINTPAIAVLLVYWLLCTAVYIIIDIVVKGFTWLTHLIGER